MQCTVVLRLLVIGLLGSLLAACQSAPQAPPPSAAIDVEAQFDRLESHLAAEHLEQAETVWLQLQDETGDPSRIDHYRRRLAEAFMRRGEDAIGRGDMREATKALNHARALMPAAPALTNGLACTINCLRSPVK